MKEIERLIKALDKKTKEVLIDAKVLKINLGDAVKSGVEWEGLFDVSGKNGMTYVGSYPFSGIQAATDPWRSRREVLSDVGYVGAYPSSGTTTNQSGGQSILGLDRMHIGVIGANDFDVMVEYLKTTNNAKILSNPKIAVTNNQEARIHVGERQAYVTTTTTTGQSASTISEDVNFIDIGIQMSVTPKINDDGFVTLQLKTEISSVIDVLITPTENRIPIVDTSLAETTVLIMEGKTIVIGGLRREENTEFVRRIPILSKIPILGKLFQKSETSKGTTELIIMITPTIISGDTIVLDTGTKIGIPNIKAVQEYDDFERTKNDKETFKPVSPDFGGMELKSFKVYQEIRTK